MMSFDSDRTLPDLSGSVGLRCVRVSQAHHIWEGEVDRSAGPVQIDWSDGSVVLLEVRSDWTMRVTLGPWVDYYKDASAEEREVLSVEVGLWVLEDHSDVDPARDFIGRTLKGIEDISNEADELVGLFFVFGAAALYVFAWGGEPVMERGPAE